MFPITCKSNVLAVFQYFKPLVEICCPLKSKPFVLMEVVNSLIIPSYLSYKQMVFVMKNPVHIPRRKMVLLKGNTVISLK